MRASFTASLERLGVDRVRLLQLHNSVTSSRGDLPTSVTLQDVFGRAGIVAAFESLMAEGRVDAFGFTGLGDQQSVDELVQSRVFNSVQVPLNLLTPFAGQDRSAGSIDVDYETLVQNCARHDVGVIAIRVFAGGALVGQSPSPHTYKTKFFSMDLFQRDQQRALQLRSALPDGLSLAEASLRFVLSVPGVTTALLGIASPEQVDQAVSFASKGPIDTQTWEQIRRIGHDLHLP